MGGMIYLDNAETTRVDPEVVEVMRLYMLEKYGVPIGEFGSTMEEESSEVLEGAREVIARNINANPEEIVFTSGGTESNALAIKGVAHSKRHEGTKVVASKIEHLSVLDTLRGLGQGGFDTLLLDVDGEGFVDLEGVRRSVDGARLVSVQHANQEIGTLQDLKAIGEVCEEKDVLFHCDAVQSFTKEPIDVEKVGIHLLSVSSHLIHGPKGVGALFVRKGVHPEPLLLGDDREFGLRAGTPNIPGIAGFAKAVDLVNAETVERMRGLRDQAIDLLLEIEDSKLNGPRGERRLCNNVNVTFRYVEGEAVLMHADLEGLVINTGSACYSERLEVSHVIRAIGGTHEEAHGSIRLSPSKWTTGGEIVSASEILGRVVDRLRKVSPLARARRVST